MFIKNIYILLSVIYISFSSLLGQKRVMHFDKIPFDRLTCLHQDKFGFMWIGTVNGLFKYDGYKTIKYARQPFDSTSISSNWVTVIKEDSKGNLYIGTHSEGLNYYNQRTGIFHRYNLETYPEMSPLSNFVSGIEIENDSLIWIGTEDRLISMRITKSGIPKFKVLQIVPLEYDNQKNNNPRITYLFKDSQDNLWIGTLRDGLRILDLKTKKIQSFYHDPADINSISSNSISVICEDSVNNIWIGTGNNWYDDVEGSGICRYNRQSEKFISFKYGFKDTNSISLNNISSILISKDNTMYVGTDGGLCFIKIKDLYTNTKYRFQTYRNLELEFKIVRTIYEDEQINLWIAGVNDIFKLNQQQNKFHWKGKTTFISILIDKSGKFWYGIYKKGLACYDPIKKDFKYYQSKDISSDWIGEILEGPKGYLWICTRNSLCKFDPKTETYTKILPSSEHPFEFPIYLMLMRNSGDILLHTGHGGLYIYKTKNDQLIKVYSEELYKHGLYLSKFYEDKYENIWIGAYNGFYSIDLKNEKVLSCEYYRHDPDDEKSLSYNHVNDILRPSVLDTNAIWITTMIGLNRYDLITKNFTHFYVEDGLHDNATFQLLEDDQGNIWFTTTYSIGKYDIKTKEITTFTKDNGLPDIKFWTYDQATAKDSDGKLYIVGTPGVISFWPPDIKESQYIPDIYLTNFKIFHENVKLDTSIQFKKNILLDYFQNSFSFEFTAINYANSHNTVFAYKMEGLFKDWIEIGNQRNISFTDLDPGEYVFHVKGSNEHNKWNETGASVKITILPPWWRTTWAYALYFIIILLLIYFIRQYDLKRQKLKHQFIMEHEHTEKLQEIDQMKSKFFANISHEFRTPLTLIEGPVKQLMEGSFKGNVQEYYNIILRNTRRLLSLINQMLDLSKIDAGRMERKAIHLNIVPLIKSITMTFESKARQSNISLEFETEDECIPAYIDSDHLETIMINLLSNAFNHTPEGNNIRVQISSPLSVTRSQNGKIKEKIHILVSNTGSYIPSERINYIFDRFYQADTDPNHDSTGIGLALVKELVELNEGIIFVESSIDHGTIFKLQFPFDKKYKHRSPEYEISSSLTLPNDLASTGLEKDKTDVALAAKKELPLLLIVEDNADVRYYIRNHLNNSFQIIEAEDGAKGFATAIKKVPDIIISDVMMPVMDGFELCKKIKSDERTSHIPVILLTARASSEDKIEGLEYGADDYVTKPFDTKELLTRSYNLIKQRKQLCEYYTKNYMINPEYQSGSSANQTFLKKAVNIIEKHLSEEDFSVVDFAREIGFSQSQLKRKLGALTGMPPSHFIRLQRLLYARQMLERQTDNISQIAYDCGFNNLSYFSRSFKEQFGYLPSDYIEHNS